MVNLWSGKRGSNPRPSRWQRDALSTELFPQIGGQRRDRTADTGIFSPLLYQLSYLAAYKKMATWMGLEPTTSAVTGRRSNQLNYQAKKSGGHNRARTYDPLLVRQMLSQLSYAPTLADN